MVWFPIARLELLKVAVVTPPVVLSVPWPMLVDASEKVTVPVGLAAAVLPGALTVTVAVKVTNCPDADGLGEEVTAVLLLALLTICPPGRVPELLAKLLSPLYVPVTVCVLTARLAVLKVVVVTPPE